MLATFERSLIYVTSETIELRVRYRAVLVETDGDVRKSYRDTSPHVPPEFKEFSPHHRAARSHRLTRI